MDAMQKDAHFSQIQVLKVDGGASNNNLLMQMQADALQVGHSALLSSGQTPDSLAVLQKQSWQRAVCNLSIESTCLIVLHQHISRGFVCIGMYDIVCC